MAIADTAEQTAFAAPHPARKRRSAPPASARVHYLDNLRALAMLLGVFLHGAFAYADPAQSFWLATDRQASVAIDAAIWFVHLFRMSLFFLLSGYFAKLVVDKKGLPTFLQSRALRLALPFALFYPFLLGAMSLLFVFALRYVPAPQGLLGLIAEASKNPSGEQAATPWTTMHLWFLYYLMLFSAAAAFLSMFPRPKVEWLARRPWLFVLAPLLLLPGIIGAGVPIPSPESFIPAWWPFAFYGPFFAAGWWMYGREERWERFQRYAWPVLCGSAILFVPYYLCLPDLNLQAIVAAPSPQPWWKSVAGQLLTAYLSVSLTIAMLLLGKRYLSRPSPLLKFIADASYWVYLIHLPIVLFLQTLLIPLECSCWLKLAIVMFATLIFCGATYLVFVRYTPLGWLLHGKRTFP